MTFALVGGLALLAMLGIIFVASRPVRSSTWLARLGRSGGLVVLLAVSFAAIAISLVLLPDLVIAGSALLGAGVLLLALAGVAALGGWRGGPVDRP